MQFDRKVTLLLAISASTLAIPAPTFAQPDGHHAWSQNDDDDNDASHGDEDGHSQRYANEDQEIYGEHHAPVYRGDYCRNDGTTGLVLGALAGGYIGHQLAGRHHRTIGAIAGGTGGALAGRAIDRGC